jgi:SseB protein N-terminal domain
MSATGQLIVPVRTVSGMVSLRCGHLPTGERVGIAFTTEAHLAAVMGAGQPWIEVSEQALAEMLEPVGVNQVQVNPGLVTTSLPVPVPA